jgi:hypothetical protein
LGDNHVYASPGGFLGGGDRTHLMTHLAAYGMNAGNVGGRVAEKNDNNGTRSSVQTVTLSSHGKCRRRFTPKGLSVSCRTRRIAWRSNDGG